MKGSIVAVSAILAASASATIVKPHQRDMQFVIRQEPEKKPDCPGTEPPKGPEAPHGPEAPKGPEGPGEPGGKPPGGFPGGEGPKPPFGPPFGDHPPFQVPHSAASSVAFSSAALAGAAVAAFLL
ncbi:hypothetical protein F5Y16DRAFT_357690 [Xylariaceae sp. FL0255]|nr:hypothetical protein F5Y16DRAFT_357690 [Xylariaceae sp. FL0255]